MTNYQLTELTRATARASLIAHVIGSRIRSATQSVCQIEPSGLAGGGCGLVSS
jgi:hypothetical protein